MELFTLQVNNYTYDAHKQMHTHYIMDTFVVINL